MYLIQIHLITLVLRIRKYPLNIYLYIFKFILNLFLLYLFHWFIISNLRKHHWSYNIMLLIKNHFVLSMDFLYVNFRFYFVVRWRIIFFLWIFRYNLWVTMTYSQRRIRILTLLFIFAIRNIHNADLATRICSIDRLWF